MERCVLITGCSSGIGHATALAFAREGWDVVATGRTPSALESLREMGCRTQYLDVTDSDSIESVVESIRLEFGRLDCLVNNAGYAQLGPLEDIPIERLREQFSVNVFGPQRLSNEVLPLMRKTERGTIISVSSSTTAATLPGTGAYAGSKAATEAMQSALRREVAHSQIHVVTIIPGTVNTAFATRARKELSALDRTPVYSPVYRLLDDWLSFDGGGPGAVEPTDVADTIVNAASATQPEPAYVVGPIGKLARISHFLPDRIHDVLVSVVLRLNSRRGNA